MAIIAALCIVLAITVFPCHHSIVCGRLTEFRTERFPILAHNLHRMKINLKTLSNRAQLGPLGGFKYKNGEFRTTTKGSKRVKLVQTYAGYQVYGPTVAAELTMNDHFTGQLYGLVARNLHKDIPNPESCARDLDMLMRRAMRLEKLHPDDQRMHVTDRDGRRVIYADAEQRHARIVYVVEFFYRRESFRSFPVYYIDACWNRVLFSYNKIRNASIPHTHREKRSANNNNQTNRHDSNVLTYKTEKREKSVPGCVPSVAGYGGNQKRGKITYNTYPFCLPATKDGDTCTMEGTYVKVIDNENSKSTSKTTVISFPCSDGYDDGTNGAYGVANDALYYGENLGKFFNDQYGMKVMTYKPRLVVHFKKNYPNAELYIKDFYFGDGDGEFYPFVIADLIYHELVHKFTMTHSDLVYLFQMGAIDESFSDIAAVTAKKYVSGTLDWKIGVDLYKSGSKATRYLNDPPKDGHSIKNIWRYHPLMNVHYSSGIFNYAFFKLVDEQGMDILDAFEDFLIANLDFWGRFTRFRKGACNVMQASYENGHDYKKVKNAFQSTGIRLKYCDHVTLKTTIFPGETRGNIKVKRTRSPILEIDMRKWRGVAVRAKANDASVVRILVAIDSLAENIIAQGENYINFPRNNSILHVKLMSESEADVNVSLTVLT